MKSGIEALLEGGLWVSAPSNQSFALVRDEATGVEFSEVWDERMPFGSYRYRVNGRTFFS